MILTIIMSKKNIFVLKNVDYQTVDQKYGLIVVSNITGLSTSSEVTKITDIIDESKHSISFLDENTKEYECTATMGMVDLEGNSTIKTNCFWCRHEFNTKSIGCPIRFVNSSIEKSYISQITKDEYYMKENLTQNKLKKILDSYTKSINIIPLEKNFYLTDGIFCSFNCVLAFIKENSHDVLYRESKSLLHSMYEDLTGHKNEKIIHAPHWRLLKEYGGHMSIDEFRHSFNRIGFKFIFNLVRMVPISKVYKNE